MSGLKPRQPRAAHKLAHEPAPEPAQKPAPPQTPQRPPAVKPQEPKPQSETPQDKLGAVLMALAGKSPDAMPDALTWSRSGAVTVLPPGARAGPAKLASPPDVRQSRAAELLQALTGQRAATFWTRDMEATWALVTAALAAGQPVVAGGGDDTPGDRRARTALVCAAGEVDGQRVVTVADGDAAPESLPLAELCREFTEIAVVDPA